MGYLHVNRTTLPRYSREALKPIGESGGDTLLLLNTLLVRVLFSRDSLEYLENNTGVIMKHVDEELKRLAQDLEAKRKIALEKMGNKWILHPEHHIQKLKDVEPLILG